MSSIFGTETAKDIKDDELVTIKYSTVLRWLRKGLMHPVVFQEEDVPSGRLLVYLHSRGFRIPPRVIDRRSEAPRRLDPIAKPRPCSMREIQRMRRVSVQRSTKDLPKRLAKHFQ